jgi:hypothetical protein
MNQEKFDELVAKEDVLECPNCYAYSAYCWDDVNMDPNSDERYEDCIDEPHDIYHIGACSGLGEWQCGKCDTYWMERDSPLAAECYTHVDYSQTGDWDD